MRRLLGLEVERHGGSRLHTGVNRHDRQGQPHLHQRQSCGHRQTEEIDSLAIDFDLQGGKVRSAQDQDDAETGEAEKKDQQRSRDQRRQEQGQRNFTKDSPAAGAQHRGGLFQPRIQVRPKAAHHAQHNGSIVEDVRQQDHPDRLLHLQRRLAEVQNLHQPAIHLAIGAEQGAESCRHHHRRHDEGDGAERPEHGFAREGVAGEDIGRGQAEDQRQQRRDGRLPGGKPEYASIVRLLYEHRQGRQVEPSVRREAEAQNFAKRIEKEEGQERQRGHQRRRPSPFPAPCARQSALPHLQTPPSPF